MFTSPDTIIPNLYNSLDWNRYGYARNNPVRYNDPSGHSVDCGLGDKYCTAGEYTPGGLIALEFDKHDSILGVKNATKKEIETYMASHTSYNPKKDPYLSGVAMNTFNHVRIEYWTDRMRESGVCNVCPGETGRLMAYYDFHETVRMTGWDSTSVSWANVTLDAIGIPLTLLGANLARFGQGGTYILNTTNAVDSATSWASANSQDDGLGQALAVGSAIPIPHAALFSFMSLVRDLSAGQYEYNWSPSIPR